MALDTSIGGAASDSYATLVEANAYHTARGFNTEWGAASDPNKELALKWAARQMDAHFSFRGVRYQKAQARAWPRIGATDDDGWDFTTAEIPKCVKDAQAELAFRLIKEDWTEGQGPMRDEGVSLGSLKTTKEEHDPMPDAVKRLLSSVTLSSGSSVRSISISIG